eukprot:scaffold10025_cov180-Amphora_coffeaeformis.AAC.14
MENQESTKGRLRVEAALSKLGRGPSFSPVPTSSPLPIYDTRHGSDFERWDQPHHTHSTHFISTWKFNFASELCFDEPFIISGTAEQCLNKLSFRSAFH